MKKTTLLMIGALAFVLQSASAQYSMYSDNFEGQTVGAEAVTTPYPGADTGTGSEASTGIWTWTGGATGSGLTTVASVLSTDGVTSTLAGEQDFANTDPSGGWMGQSSQEHPTIPGGQNNALSDITISFDVQLLGTANPLSNGGLGSDTPITIWLDQSVGGVKGLDASYIPDFSTMSQDAGGWYEVSFTADMGTLSGAGIAYNPNYGLQVAIDGGNADTAAGATGSWIFDNINVDATYPTYPTPEPGTIAILTVGGLAALVGIRRRRA
jgi:hypothetical protein